MDQYTGATLVSGGLNGPVYWSYLGVVAWWVKWTSILELPWRCGGVNGPVYWSYLGVVG